jgi:hypothetical protein
MIGTVDDLVKRLRNVANPLTVVGTFALFLVAALLIQTIGFRPEVESMAEGLALPEVQFVYTPDDVESVLDALGSDGRDTYIRALLVDFVFVVTFAAGLGVPLAYLLPKLTESTWIGRLAVAPVIAGLCDYVENVVLLYAITAFPDTPTAGLWIASVFTSVKLVLLIGSLILLVISGVIVLGRTLFRRL